MAVEKILIADKPTQDLIKTAVDNVNANVDTVGADVKAINTRTTSMQTTLNNVNSQTNAIPKGAVKSTQRGSIYFGFNEPSSPKSVPISSVNPAKCLVIITGAWHEGGMTTDKAVGAFGHTISSTILSITSLSRSQSTAYWQVIEFY